MSIGVSAEQFLDGMHIMESQITLSAMLVLIAIAAAHILEEAVMGFRRFFNHQWFNASENCPVTRFKGIFFDKIGLFAAIVGLSLFGLIDNRLAFVAIGIISADLVQHLAFSVRQKAYTPGVATCALYLAYLAYFFAEMSQTSLIDPLGSWVAFALGAAGIAGNYLYAQWKVQRGHCEVKSGQYRSA